MKKNHIAQQKAKNASDPINPKIIPLIKFYSTRENYSITPQFGMQLLHLAILVRCYSILSLDLSFHHNKGPSFLQHSPLTLSVLVHNFDNWLFYVTCFKHFIQFESTILDVSQTFLLLHCKKKLPIFPSPAGMSLTDSWPGIIKIFPARESLVSDIPAGDGKIGNPFLQCTFILSSSALRFFFTT